jgi:ligand-binding sensor domain-containing protein/signal transduction histidine kinase
MNMYFSLFLNYSIENHLFIIPEISVAEDILFYYIRLYEFNYFAENMKLKTLKFPVIIIFLHFFFAVSLLLAQNPVYKFERISVGQGLSQSSVTAMVQDRDGFLWFGTIDGLNRYDGYNFTIYRHHDYENNSLPVNWISSLLIDRSGELWVCTFGGGICRFDKHNGSFYKFQHDQKNTNSIPSNNIFTAIQDINGIFWMGSDSGLIKYDPVSFRFTNYKISNKPGFFNPSNFVKTIYEDSLNNLWVGTFFGLYLFNREKETFNPVNLHNIDRAGNMICAITEEKSGTFWISSYGGFYYYNTITGKIKLYKNIAGNNNSLSNNSVQAILTENNFLWIATYGGGLEKFDIKNEKFIHLLNSPTDPFSLSNNNIKSLFIDKSGILWIGTEAGGLNKNNSKNEKFRHFKNIPTNPNSLNNNLIFSLLLDHNDNLWIGTWGGGINKYDRKNNKFKFYKILTADIKKFGINTIKSLLEDKYGNIWAGTYGCGLLKLNRNTDQFDNILIVDYNNFDERLGNFANCLFEDSRGTIWIGTEGNGLYKYNETNKSFKHIRFFQNNLPTAAINSITTIQESPDGYFWIGTSGGLVKFDPKTENFSSFENNIQNPGSLSNNHVKSIFIEKDGTIWAGTTSGLNKYDKTTNTFTRFTTKDGLPNDLIYGILDDKAGNLWLSTNKGLCKFNPHTYSINNYTPGDGLQDYEFNSGAYYKSADGEMFFGGLKGFNSFSPENILLNENKPPIKLISFKIFGQSAEFDRPITEMKLIELPYYNNFISFEFIALDYLDPANNKYAYILEGFDDKWIYSGTRHIANYTNLDPGEYTLKIKGSNSDGVWNEEGISLTIRIIPPIWRTTWFKISAGAFVVFFMLALYLLQMRRTKKQQEILENLVKDRTWELNKKSEELQIINNIILSIGSEIDFVQLLNKALDQLKSVSGVERSAALIRQGDTEEFKFTLHSGFSEDIIDKISINYSNYEDQYIKFAELISEDIYIFNNYNLVPSFKGFEHIKRAKSSFILRIVVNNRIEAYLIFENMQKENVFNNIDIELLKNIKESFNNAFKDAINLEKLKTLNNDNGFFLGRAAHNLMNPLSIIINYATNLYENMSSSNFDMIESKKELSQILNISDRMKNLLSELMQIASMEAGKISFDYYEVNLKLALDPSIEFYEKVAKIKSINFINKINYPLPRVYIDNRKIMEVMDNLLSNAVKFTYPDGTIIISSEIIRNQVIISVQDTGQGLDESEIKDLFKSFKRLSARPTGGESSTGLGLAIVKKIIENHGGEIFTESRKGFGSTFKFSLPIRK